MKFWHFVGILSTVVMVCALMVSASNLQSSKTLDLNALTDSDLSTIAITFERTGCYGTCPSYLLTIKGDGTVQYTGRDNVKVKETREGTIKLGAIRGLLSEFARANFLSISDDYSSEKCKCGFCTDLPSAIVGLRVKGATQAVNHYYGCRCAPRSLFGLETAIDKSVNVEQWTGDVSKSGPFGTTCN